MDEITLTLSSPMTEEQWDMIADYDFNHTNEITFHTKHGKIVKFVKESAQPEPQWIPCSERLPDEDHWTGNNFQYSADVLMTVYNAGDEETIIDYGHTADGKWYSDTTDCYVPSEWEVTAWMPLPEPYNPT